MQRAITYSISALLVLSLQLGVNAQSQDGTAVASANIAAAPPAAAPNLQPMLAELYETVSSTRVSIAKLRIDKWKTDKDYKRQAQSDSESVERNMAQALPALMDAARTSPQSLVANFNLYRNLNALHDVVAALTEMAGAFGQKEEYRALSADVSRLDAVRRAFADRMEAMAAQKDAEIARLYTQLRAAQSSSAGAAPPKKIVIDDAAPKPKSKPKKKAATAAKPKPEAAPPPQ